MNENRLNCIVLLFLSLSVLFAGCAHKPVAGFQAGPDNSRLYQNRKPLLADSNQIVTDTETDAGFDDNFFEDEFEKEKVSIKDPLAPWNRMMYHLNDKLYFWLLKPLAKAYKTVTPDIFRIGVKNFFRNLATPIRFVNCVLQGKGNAASLEFARFIMNSTLGVLGFGSPADDQPHLAMPDEEDLGQTLATYGIGNGFYIVWPVLGPSTLRDSIGMVGDFFLNPITYVEPGEAELGIKSFEKVNQTSFQLGDYEALKKASVDPYTAIRSFYLQHRQKKVQK